MSTGVRITDKTSLATIDKILGIKTQGGIQVGTILLADFVELLLAGKLGDMIEAAEAGVVWSATLAGLPAGTRIGQPGEVTTGPDRGKYAWNGTTWVKIADLLDIPIPANAAAVLAGVSANTYVSPATLAPLHRQSNNLLAEVAGTAAAYTATTNITLASIVTRQTFLFPPHVDNDATPTLNVGGLGAAEIRDEGGNPLAAGVMKAGSVYPLLFLSPYYRLLTATSAALVAQIAALSSRIDNLTGGDTVSDVYDESTTIGTTSAVIIGDDQPISSAAIMNLSDTATVYLGVGNQPAQAGAVGSIILPPGMQIDQKGIPKGAVSAIATAGDTKLSIMIGNNSLISPNSNGRVTDLLRSMDTARGSITPVGWEAAIRTLYYELDRLAVLRSAAAFGMFAMDAAGPSLIEWTSRSAMTAVNAPTFTAKQGFTFDGATSYIRTFRRMSQGKGVTSHRGAVAIGAKYAGSVQLAKYAIGDGAWGISPYRSGTTWGALVSATQADVVAGFTTADADMIAQRRDDFSAFARPGSAAAQRFSRDGRETNLNADILIGANNSSTDVVAAGTYWNGTAKWFYAGPPLGGYQWLGTRTAINAFITAVASL